MTLAVHFLYFFLFKFTYNNVSFLLSISGKLCIAGFFRLQKRKKNSSLTVGRHRVDGNKIEHNSVNPI